MRLAVIAMAIALAACTSQVAPAAPLAEAPAQPAQARLAPRPLPLLARTEDDYAAFAGTAAETSGLKPFAGRFPNWPITGQITSSFGPRWGGFHTGLDIAAPMNTPVLAAAAGEVVVVGKPYLAFGDTATIVIIAHGRDLATMYVHLSDGRPPAVKVGQRVDAGQISAYCGSTGFSTGPHLHFMTIVNGRPVDPIPYLP